MVGADQPAARSGYELVKFFFFFQLRRGDPGHHLRLRRRRGPGRPQLLATAVIGWKIDVLGVWPLHSLCAVWGGTAGGVFGTRAQAGLGGSIGRPS
ncbi:MAG: ammonium transporter [Ramlibacter sp.]|nr:ammonium transporter [Ramlibacter sp.]